MSSPQSTTTIAPYLRREGLNATRYHLGKRWVLLALSVALIIGLGLYFGGWAWLVAIGVAPVILSILPCLIMCGSGVCMACLSFKKRSPAGAADTAASGSVLAATKILPAAGLSCCHADVGEESASASMKDSVAQEKEESHA